MRLIPIYLNLLIKNYIQIMIYKIKILKKEKKKLKVQYHFFLTKLVKKSIKFLTIKMIIKIIKKNYKKLFI